jgi:hypothetical protein
VERCKNDLLVLRVLPRDFAPDPHDPGPTRLLARNTHSVALTEQGAEFLRSARRIVAEADWVGRRLNLRTFTVGCVSGALSQANREVDTEVVPRAPASPARRRPALRAVRSVLAARVGSRVHAPPRNSENPQAVNLNGRW